MVVVVQKFQKPQPGTSKKAKNHYQLLAIHYQWWGGGGRVGGVVVRVVVVTAVLSGGLGVAFEVVVGVGAVDSLLVTRSSSQSVSHGSGSFVCFFCFYDDEVFYDERFDSMLHTRTS